MNKKNGYAFTFERKFQCHYQGMLSAHILTHSFKYFYWLKFILNYKIRRDLSNKIETYQISKFVFSNEFKSCKSVFKRMF